MLISIVNPKEEVIYEECQHLKDLYADGKIVGVYSTYFIEGHWVIHIMKTIMKNKVEVIDNMIIKTEGVVDWQDVDKRFDDYLNDVKCVIVYDEPNALSFAKSEPQVLDINLTTMHCSNYFNYRGMNVSNIEYARAMFEYGEGVEGLRLDIVLLELINEIIDKYSLILEEDKKSE